MNIQHISSGATAQRNDDHIAMHAHDGVHDVLVIDGATSVADRDYIDVETDDVAWFVHAFAAALRSGLACDRSQHDSVHAAVDVVHAAFVRHADGREVPGFA